MSKRAQGMSFEMIVLIIIALVILVIFVAWISGALGSIFQQTRTISEVTEADVIAAQTKCTQYCLAAQGVNEIGGWTSSNYCTYVFKGTETGRDWSGDGQITEAEDNINCRDFPISTTCSAEIAGETITEVDC